MRGFKQIAGLTLISRILGMLRDMAFAHFLGLSGLMDIWSIAFKIPNLSRRIFGEGAAASSLIPVYSEELKKNPPSAADLARTVLTVVFVLLAGIVLVGEIGIWWYCKYHVELQETRQMLTLTALMLPYMCLICTVAILAGLLNAHRHFAMPAAAPIVLNIFIIGAMCFSAWVLKASSEAMLMVMAIGVLLAGLAQMAIQLWPMSKYGLKLYPAWHVRTPGFRKIMFLMGPMILGVTVTQLNTLADDVIAKTLSGSAEKGLYFNWFGLNIQYPVPEGSVSSLYFSQRLYQFPLGVLGISLATAIFPVLSAAAANNDQRLLSQTIRQGVQAAVFIALPATVGLILIARPLAALIYQHGEFTTSDTKRVQVVLIFYSLGLCGYFLQQLITRAFYSIQNSKWPAYTSIISVFLNVFLNLTLIWKMGVAGLALATASCSYIQVIILITIWGRKYKFPLKTHFWSIQFKSLIGTVFMAIMGVLCHDITQKFPQHRLGDFFTIFILVGVCSGTYIVAARLMNNEILGLLLRSSRESQAS
jgi:putative peptidoglycan lipid II flippase